MAEERKKMMPLTSFEKDVLLELVKQFKEKIENKKTDSVSLKDKNRAWEELSREFNAVGSNKRSASQLKKCWNNIKFKCRNMKTAERKERLATGGGPSPKDDKDADFLSAVDGVLPHLNLRISSEFDSDGFRADEDEDEEMEQFEVCEEVGVETQLNCDLSYASLPEVDNRSKDTSTQAEKKKRKEENLRATAVEYLSEKKDLEFAQMRELHELKMKHEKEVHELNLKHMTELHEKNMKKD